MFIMHRRSLDTSGGDDVGLGWRCHGMAEPLMMSRKYGVRGRGVGGA